MIDELRKMADMLREQGGKPTEVRMSREQLERLKADPRVVVTNTGQHMLLDGVAIRIRGSRHDTPRMPRLDKWDWDE